MSIERSPHLVTKVSESLKFLEGRKIGLDIDAVTQATFILGLRNASEHLRKVILKEWLTTYWQLANIAKENGIPEADAMSFAKGVWNRHDVYLNAPPMPGIKTLLETFDKIGVSYVFISSRPVEFLDTTREWFRNTFPQVKGENIILGRAEGMTGGKFKADTARSLNLGLFIEDAPEEAVVIAGAGIPVLLVPQPWNANEKIDSPLIKRLGDYDHTAGTWPVLRFLATSEAKEFFASVAQY